MIYYCQFIGCASTEYVLAAILIILFFAVGVPMLLIAKARELFKARATRTAAKDADRLS